MSLKRMFVSIYKKLKKMPTKTVIFYKYFKAPVLYSAHLYFLVYLKEIPKS